MSHDPTPAPLDAERIVSRRSVTAAAAWTVPVVAVAVATPSAAASLIDVGPFQLNGSCGLLNVVGPGFTLTASGASALPAGTTLTITGSGVANVALFTATGVTADITALSATSQRIVLTAPVPAGTTVQFRTLLSIAVAFQLNALVAVPPATHIGTGAKTTATVRSRLVLGCDTPN
ncbi:hypothetical protein MT349_06810 [Rathayibacter caricis]|uniref:hypothetical protein n=1 Tax=Rathayibacter caricis TaxID=110936 RepID=UPI001FB2AF06|nr:hypothetical protein [Rathayibacter caricis]MCJ1695487.1 hypothetical protein [Rathayibacter caricis]